MSISRCSWSWYHPIASAAVLFLVTQGWEVIFPRTTHRPPSLRALQRRTYCTWCLNLIAHESRGKRNAHFPWIDVHFTVVRKSPDVCVSVPRDDWHIVPLFAHTCMSIGLTLALKADPFVPKSCAWNHFLRRLCWWRGEKKEELTWALSIWCIIPQRFEKTQGRKCSFEWEDSEWKKVKH